MAALVSFSQAKDHLRITTDDADPDVHLKMEQASAIVIRYLKSQADPTWTDLTVPGNVQAATLIVLGHLHEHRGEDMATHEAMWASVANLLASYRDPALA